MPRYKLTIEYDGGGFCGWQRQENDMSVQEALEDAFFALLRQRITVWGAGRTDAGVHAAGQVAHCDLPTAFPPKKMPLALNAHLRIGANGAKACVVVAAEETHSAFDARRDATQRVYRYRILNRRMPSALDAMRAWHVAQKLDTDAMRHAARHLEGHHDFSAFRAAGCQAASAQKTLDALTLTIQHDEVIITARARSFLYRQVRIMAGTLKDVGCGAIDSAQEIPAILQSKDRARAGVTAPPHGLCLTHVHYDT